VIELLDFLYPDKKSEGPGGPGGPAGTLGNDVTRKGQSFYIGVQYGNTFWGRNTEGSQEIVMKVSFQY
jgi:hypothetical protein